MRILLFARKSSDDATRNDVKLIEDPGAARRARLVSKGAALPPAPADFPPRTIRSLEYYSEAIRRMGRENQYHPGTSEVATRFHIRCGVGI